MHDPLNTPEDEVLHSNSSGECRPLNPDTDDTLLGGLLEREREARRHLEEANQRLRAAHRELQREKVTVDTVINHSPDGMILADTAGFVTICNPMAQKLLVASSSLVGKNLLSEFPNVGFDQIFEQLLDPGRSTTETILVTSYYRRRLEIRAQLIEDAGAPPGSCAISIRDITREKQREEAKDALIGIISHELRTPLTTILGCLDLLPAEVFDPQDARVMIERIREATRRLQTIVNELIAFAEQSRGSIPANFGLLDIAQVVGDVLNDLAPVAEEQGVRLTLVQGDRPSRIRGDRGQIERAIQELVSNALSVSETGDEVLVTVAEDEDETVIISVKDEGPGIHPVDHDRVFEPFQQTEDYRTRSRDGLGLGLTLVRHIVALHNGTVGIRSRPGQGTELVIRLPRAHDTSPAADGPM